MSGLVVLSDSDVRAIGRPLPGEAKSVDDLVRFYDNDTWAAWQPDPQHLADNMPGVYQVDAWRAMEAPDKDTFLYRFLKVVWPQWKVQYQRRGTCVGQGFKGGCDILIAGAHLMYGSASTRRACVAGCYAGGRVDVGRRPGRWDGSNGSWTSKWLVEVGGVLELADIDLDEYNRTEDERLAVAWTASREGVPRAMEDEARTLPVKGRRLCTDAREAGKAIQNGNPAIQGSGLIPTGKRDRHGFSPVRRSGGHCTLFGAVRYDPFGLLYINSWNTTWGSGGKFPDDMPDGTVWVDENDANAIIRQRDTYILLGLGGIEPQYKDRVILATAT